MRALAMSRLTSELDDALERRTARGLRRERRIVGSAQGARLRVDGREVLHFGSNDYLGLAGERRVVAAAQEGAARYGVGAGASHLISGHFAPHDTMERELAAWIAPCASARALLFSTGYLANLAIVTALVGRGDAVFADKLNHACLNDAALLSRADFVRYAHADLKTLEERLASSGANRKLIATDAVFSMDGDIAALGSLLELADKYDAWLAVDDAHGFGVLGEESAAGPGNSGRGTLAQLGLVSERVVYMATLGKAAGVAGAFVAAHESVIETLIQTARSYIFTTAAPPMLSCALAASLALIRDEPERRAHLFALIDRWRDAAAALPWRTLPSITAIQPLILGANADALRISDALWKRDIWVPAIRPPTVPLGSARLRITFSASHTIDDVDRLAEALADVAQ
jgi:8-amino-7-oxononanoate synthase